MDFILTLHSHLPYVLHHGRWPHGSDWLTEAAIDTYLPLLEVLQGFERDGVDAPITLGITPVLANQLSHPSFVSEMEAFFEHRIESAEEAPESLRASNDAHLIPVAKFWEDRLHRLRGLFRAVNGDLAHAFGEFQRRGRIEIISCAATHGFLPLLGCDESIRLQLFTGRNEHVRLFGRAPVGIWLPECAFRPAGPWTPPGYPPGAFRRGTDEFLRDAGYKFFFVDAHLVNAGGWLGRYHEIPLGTERFGAERHALDDEPEQVAERSAYKAYRMPDDGSGRPLMAFVRDPKSSLQVWSRWRGYPGDPNYLEFHKIRWPGGLKLWAVTGPETDLGDKVPYNPEWARGRAGDHARHFASLLMGTALGERGGQVICAPFDTELFGHWWYEGVDFINDLYRALQGMPVKPVSGKTHVARRFTRPVVRLTEGSWGANGDFSFWMNDQTKWSWERMWALEQQYWAAARPALRGSEGQRRVLEQATRSLLLAQASDWQFVISTGAAGDYATKRLNLHFDDLERLLGALAPGADDGALEAGVRFAEEIRARDDLFPNVLGSVEEALA